MSNPDPQSPPPPTTVLVVDDETASGTRSIGFLTRLGYRVLQAASGAEALDRPGCRPAEVMLSDIRMPNMSGVELVPKALAADSDLAIIMLTAIDEPRTAIECLKLGAYDYLIKPVDLDELEMSLQSGLRQRQLEIDRRELEQWLAREVAYARAIWRSERPWSRTSRSRRWRPRGTGPGRATPSRSWRRNSHLARRRDAARSGSGGERQVRPSAPPWLSPHTACSA